MRQHSYTDREFGRPSYNPNDYGDFEKNLVFVGMSFDGVGCAETYAAIQDECGRLGLTARRADETVGSGFVMRAITELIERAEFIIVDLTYERPNVYYELGYAHGVGNEAEDILLVAARGTPLHFDIAPLQVHQYASTEHLRVIVGGELRRMMEATRD